LKEKPIIQEILSEKDVAEMDWDNFLAWLMEPVVEDEAILEQFKDDAKL